MEETELGSTTLAGTGASSPDRTDARLPRGAVVGRYVVLDPVGAGGMGVVYAAYDPELDRKVAIKLLHPSERSRTSSRGRQRLLREAQALARLQHPEVLTVLDVGVHDDDVFVAMEFVDGQTLRAWLREGPRPWRDVLDVFLAAGRGLQAAHAKGLVHRDFKPDNVMLDIDERTGAVERVRVMDFGLARAQGSADSTSGDTSATAVIDDLTRTGAVVGTPAYIAPEQHRGQPAQESSDQFGFCVALYECLYGERPFAGQSVAEIVATTTGGTIRPAPGGTAVPGWLREVVVRGLAVEPERRWPTMADLLEALQRDPTGRRRRWWAAGLLVSAAAGALVLVQIRERQRLIACEDASHAIDDVWGDDARARVEAALLATGMSYAAQTSALVRARLDEQVESWRIARHESCSDRTRIAPDLVAVQDECLASHLAGIADRIDILAGADKAILNRAIAMVGARGHDECLDPGQLERRVPLPDDPGARERMSELYRQLERAEILESAGKYEEADMTAEQVRRHAEGSEMPAVVAAARALRGRVLSSMARYPESERELEEAFFGALAARDEHVASRAAVMLTAVVGSSLARRDEGLRWGRQAEVLRGLGGADDSLADALEHNLGTVAFTAGDYSTAIVHFERSLELRMREYGDHSASVITVLKSLGAAYDGQGENARAIAHLERALALSEELFGLDHPLVADANNDLGAALLAANEQARAISHFERAVQIHEAAGLEEKTAASFDNLAIALSSSGAALEALALNQRALEIRQRMFPAGHPMIGITLNNRGALLSDVGRPGEAAAAYTRAIAIYEATLGPEHERVSDACFNLANTSIEMGHPGEGLAAARRALAIRRRELRPGHPKIDQAVLMLGITALAAGEVPLAIQELEGALATASQPPRAPEVESQMQVMLADAFLGTGEAKRAKELLSRVDLEELKPPDRARARFLQARAMWETGGNHEEALRLATEAVTGLRPFVPAAENDVAEMDAWLASRATRR